jgi:hypothetical protein
VLSLDELAGLVPANNIRHGAGTRGEVVSIGIADLRPEDAATVRALYAMIGALHEIVTPRVDDGLAAVPEIRACAEAYGFAGLVARVSALGAGLDANTVSPLIRKALHDIRGGGMPALMMHLEALLADEVEADDIHRIFLLCRDQRKIVRNAVPDLDPVGYAHDLEPRAHTTELLTKWSATTYRVGEHTAELHLRCDFDGEISECCMEFAALDRVVYNLVNNAARFAADGHVGLSVFAIRPDVETDLRFVVTNRIDPEQRGRIADDLGGELSRVFQGGYTTGGTGLGLRICADLVCHGYQLPSLRAALDRGYLGARIVHDHFAAWFHWPARRAA